MDTMTDIATVLAPFPHPLSFPAYAAVKAAHEAGAVTAAEWAAYDELIHTDGGSWLGFMRWNRNGGAMPEERIDNHLTEIDDAAADYAPEAGPANNPGECPICGHALEIDADGWFICPACEMAWQQQPVTWPAQPSPFEQFLARAVDLPSVNAVPWNPGRLADLIRYIVGGNYDPAHDYELTAVLNIYCSATADNDGNHTRVAAENARAGYVDRVAAKAKDARQAALATATGQLD